METKTKMSLEGKKSSPKEKVAKEPKYVYRCVSTGNSMYPKHGIQNAKNKGYTDDCTPEEYKEHFDHNLNKGAYVSFVLMRKKVG